MNSTVIRNGLRFLGLVLVQGLILQNIGVSWKEFPYMNLFIYPLFVLVLPLRAPATLVIFLGFLMGITVDVFYNSLGIHAFAMTFTAYIRPFILRQIEPRSGYNNNYSPTIRRYGNAWFAKYAAIMLGIHCFIYFFVEACCFGRFLSFGGFEDSLSFDFLSRTSNA